MNKMYLQNISQALAFGGFEGVMEKGILLTRISLKSTSHVEVFWLANDDENPREVQTLLDNVAGQVANKIMYGSISGSVPRIIFKRDLSAISASQVATTLQIVSAQIQAHEEMQKVRSTTNEDSEELPDTGPVLPQMKMDTFGLPHDKIYRRIIDSKKNAYPLHIPKPPTTEELAASLSQPSVSRDITHNRKKEIEKFMRSYKKAQMNRGALVQESTIKESYDPYLYAGMLDGDPNSEEPEFYKELSTHLDQFTEDVDEFKGVDELIEDADDIPK